MAINNLIICDIQPEYHFGITYNIYDFTTWLNKNAPLYNTITYFYNGAWTLGMINETELKFWLLDNGLDEDLLCKVEFVDKGYGFLRNAMDNEISDRLIISTLRKMKDLGIYDSRDLSTRFKLSNEDYCISWNESFNYIDKYNNIHYVGGGINECLKELLLYTRAVKKKFKLITEWVY